MIAPALRRLIAIVLSLLIVVFYLIHISPSDEDVAARTQWHAKPTPEDHLDEGTSAEVLVEEERPEAEKEFPKIKEDTGRRNTTTDDCLRSNNIVVSVKTGATEAALRIPTLMSTSLRCVPNALIFSDMEQELGEYHLYDTLNTIAHSVKDGNPEFDIYRKQYDYLRTGKDIALLKEMRDPETGDLASWTLDKYKNLRMVERAWRMQRDRDWYVFMDADTYLVWPNLVNWLQTLDPKEKLYLGSLASIGETPFAHGGTGYVLSRAAVEELVLHNEGKFARWESQIHGECCGDLVVSRVMMELGIEPMNVRPMFNGHRALTIPFSDYYWCFNVITMHHVAPQDAEEFAAFEKSRVDKGIKTPITYADIYYGLIDEDLPSFIEGWDNQSNDIQADPFAVHNTEECRGACEENEECLQFLIEGDNCWLGKRIRIGSKRGLEDGKRWLSGWMQDRIRAWARNRKDCGVVEWMQPEPAFGDAFSGAS